MPCICGKCDDKKKTVTKLAIAARDIAKLLGKPQQLLFTNFGVTIMNMTDEWPTDTTRVAVVAPSMTDEEVEAEVAAYYDADRPSFLEMLLAAIVTAGGGDESDIPDNINHN